MNVEQALLHFDKTKENIPRQITVIVPMRNVHTETGRRRIAKEIENEKRIPYTTQNSKFELEGVRGLIEKEEDAMLVAASLARYKYSVKNAYIADIGAGIYTMITNGVGLYDYQELITRDLKTGEENKVGARVIISLETLYKAAFGSLVDHNGRAIYGAGDIVDAAKDHIIPIINGIVPMPRAYASVQKVNHESGEKIEAVIAGKPIHVYRQLSGAQDALIVDLDYFFFPAVVKGDGKLSAKEMFIHQVAGLTSFLQLGSKIHSEGKKSGIDVTTARKIILAAQAAYELRFFAPDIVKENQLGRVNIVLRRGAVENLYPSAVDSHGYIRFKKFSNAVSLAGQYFKHAIHETGIMNELKKRGKILIPAIDKGAEFPKDHPQKVYIKADKAK